MHVPNNSDVSFMQPFIQHIIPLPHRMFTQHKSKDNLTVLRFLLDLDVSHKCLDTRWQQRAEDLPGAGRWLLLSQQSGCQSPQPCHQPQCFLSVKMNFRADVLSVPLTLNGSVSTTLEFSDVVSGTYCHTGHFYLTWHACYLLIYFL